MQSMIGHGARHLQCMLLPAHLLIGSAQNRSGSGDLNSPQVASLEATHLIPGQRLGFRSDPAAARCRDRLT